MSHYCSVFKRGALAITLSLLLAPIQAAPFEKGDMEASLLVGSGRAFNEDYTVIGAGFGYYVAQGLKLGIDAQSWQGGSVGIKKISPHVQYVLVNNEGLMPYFGAFYRKTSIDGYEDLDAAGARAGVYLSTRNNFYMSVGIAHENYLSCDEAVYVDCSDTYPEVTLSFRL